MEEAAPTADRSATARWWMAVDLAVVIGLVVIGYLVRRDGLPVDGLFFDDAWVVTGAVHGRVGDLFMVGSAHPGFTLLLKAWGRSVAGACGPSPTRRCSSGSPVLRSSTWGCAGCASRGRSASSWRRCWSSATCTSSTRARQELHPDTAVVIVIIAALPALAARRGGGRSPSGGCSPPSSPGRSAATSSSRPPWP